MCLLMLGCADVDVARAETQVAALEQTVKESKVKLVQMEALLLEARAVADRTGDANALKAVAVLSSAVAQAQQALPKVEEALAQGKELVAQLKADGDSQPVWKVAAGIAVLAAPKLLSFTPLAPLAEPIGKGLSLLLWWLTGTKKQRKEEDETEAKAAALSHQVEFANELLKKVPADVAAPIKAQTGSALELAGLYETVRPLVLAAEAKN